MHFHCNRTGAVATLGSGEPRFVLRSVIDALPIKANGCETRIVSIFPSTRKHIHFDSGSGEPRFVLRCDIDAVPVKVLWRCRRHRACCHADASQMQ